MTDSFSKEQIEEWKKDIQTFGQQPRTDFNKKQAVEALIDVIEGALENRSYKEVASRLKQRGLEISEGSLKKYVSQYRKEHNSKNTTTTQKRSTKSKKKESHKSSHPPVSKTVSDVTTPTSQRTVKKLGKGRLQTDENSSRYPNGNGEPIEINSEL